LSWVLLTRLFVHFVLFSVNEMARSSLASFEKKKPNFLYLQQLYVLSFPNTRGHNEKGQTQCRRLPHEWGLGKGKTEASLPPTKSTERLLRTHDLVTQ